MPPGSGALLAVAVVLLVLSSAACVGGLLSVLAERDLTAQTEARVTAADQVGDPGKSPRCEVAVTYEVDGRTYDLAESLGGDCPQVGGTVPARYDPALPSESTADDPSVGDLVVTLVIGLLFVPGSVALLVWSLRARRRARRDDDPDTGSATLYGTSLRRRRCEHVQDTPSQDRR